ncbi:MAG: hypothetical protein IPJ81_10360 [Chitinophagaceae bacterium]|nr:hypothetical protein [Chitinophagaceae bacterium]
MKKKILFLIGVTITLSYAVTAQKVSTKVIDNKGTIKWVLDSSTAVITKADSTLLFVTPTQLNDSLSGYIKGAQNGLTKTGQIVKLGGTLSEVTTIATSGANFLAITGLQSGSSATDSIMVIDPSNNQVKFISAASLFNALTFSNGLTKTGNEVKLGGTLTAPTTITTDATNVLKIAGLESGNLSTDSLVVATSDGTLKRVSSETLLQSGDQNFSAALNQAVYNVANMPATVSKVWVFRNGAKLLVTTDYTATAGTVTLTGPMAALVEANDVIEVQWVK